MCCRPVASAFLGPEPATETPSTSPRKTRHPRGGGPRLTAFPNMLGLNVATRGAAPNAGTRSGTQAGSSTLNPSTQIPRRALLVASDVPLVGLVDQVGAALTVTCQPGEQRGDPFPQARQTRLVVTRGGQLLA